MYRMEWKTATWGHCVYGMGPHRMLSQPSNSAGYHSLTHSQPSTMSNMLSPNGLEFKRGECLLLLFKKDIM